MHKNIFLYEKEKNGNWGSVINYVRDHKLVNSKYMMFLDSDDKIKNIFLKTLIKYDSKSNYDFLISKTSVVYFEKMKITIKPRYFIKAKNLIHSSPALIPVSLIIKSDIFYKTSNLEEGVSYQDFPFFLEALKISKNPSFVNKTTGIYWFNRPGNTMSSQWNKKRKLGEQAAFNSLIKKGLCEYQLLKLLLHSYVSNLFNSKCKIYLEASKVQKFLSYSTLITRLLIKKQIKKALKLNVLEFVYDSSKCKFEIYEN
ncbi:putative glycosyltransferase [Mycoplasma crocodyli MP145]|uniref:Putative glycosyltransferase n=2 Tax=Mycoplasma TaxID=2093 RepID=D5E5Z6_MYCCM|nr:putative glycosyltransferase [Mycoplasma crocodyli MP145]